MTSMLLDRLKTALLVPLPHHLVSRLVLRLTRLETPRVHAVIHWFVRHFGVDMSDAADPVVEHYPSFNAFFTRALRPGVRPIAEGVDEIASPADGRISAIGRIEAGRIFQAKGHDYSLLTLLGGDEAAAARLANGAFTTIYLSPRDYHRLHMPRAGRLLSQTHVPGRLYSVAPHTVRTLPGLFARNERVIAQFDTDAGLMALVLVGAINVAAIETVWHGLVTPPQQRGIQRIDYDGILTLARGDEMGRFNMGSTIIVLLENPARWRRDMAADDAVQVGQFLGHLAR